MAEGEEVVEMEEELPEREAQVATEGEMAENTRAGTQQTTQ
jgi:hypothetical protein